MTSNLAREAIHQEPQHLGAELCLACGACCRGVIFSDVVLKSDEIEKAKQLQLRLSYRHKEAQDIFQQPCACHINGRCSIYEDRFQSCKNYQCELLKRLLVGAIPLKEALEIVRMVQGLEKKLYELLGDYDQSETIWKSLEKFFAENGIREFNEPWKQHPELFFTSRTLSLVCHKYFEPRMDAQLNSKVQPVKASRELNA